MTMVNLVGDLALDESVVLLRRIVKLLESSGNNDIGNRQRIALDSITAGTTLPTVTNVAATAGVNHAQFIDPARTAYNTGIRSNLIFS